MKKTTEFQTAEPGLLAYDPIVLLRDVCKRWLVVLAAAVLVGVGAYILTDWAYTPQYQTSATLVVTTRSSSSTVYSNLSSTRTLASVFTEMLNSSVFRKNVQEAAGIDSFSGSISATAIDDTNLMVLKVTDSDPRSAFRMIRAVLEHHDTMTQQVIGDIVLEVLQSPTVPTAPSNPVNALGRMKQAMALTAVLTCFALGYASYARDTVRSGKEARQKLDCHYLGEIPHERKYKTLRAWLHRGKRSILITNPVTSFRFVETLRKIRRRVEQRMGDKKVLMVTSLLENEGKSTVAANLAMAMAKKYPKVLLIECDLHKPACHILLEHKWNGPGVRDVLQGKAEPAAAIQLDKRSGLYLLLEKKGDSRSGDLIASGRMGALLDWARQEFDYIILDLPPMAAVTDTEGVMELADASLLVVRQNAAAAPMINKAIENLGRGRAKLLGCVLNNVYSTSFSSGQGYGYGRYGRYGGYGKYGHYGHYGAYGSGSTKE